MSKGYAEFDDDGLGAPLVDGKDAGGGGGGGGGGGVHPHQLSALDKQIQALLKTLKQQPRALGANVKSFDREGWIYKKRRRGQWKRVWATLNLDQLYLYRAPDAKRPRAVVSVSFVKLDETTEEDGLVKKQVENEAAEVCRYRIRVFSPTRIFRLSAETDADAIAWSTALGSVLKENMHADDYEAKMRAATELEPLVAEQEKLEWEQYKLTMKALESAGFGSDMTSKCKEGYLDEKAPEEDRKEGAIVLAKEKEGSWRQMYFVLHNDYLFYYKLEDKKNPHRVVSLKFMSAVRHEPKEGPNVFSIVTPLRTFMLRAKHEAAMADWINKIHELKEKSKRKLQTTTYDNLDNISGEPVHGKMFLSFVINGKAKKVDVKNNATLTIGRSSSNTLKIKDRKVSRNHCKIVVKDSVPVVHDLGASRGTRVNRHRVVAQALKPGDVIKIGETELTFETKV